MIDWSVKTFPNCITLYNHPISIDARNQGLNWAPISAHLNDVRSVLIKINNYQIISINILCLKNAPNTLSWRNLNKKWLWIKFYVWADNRCYQMNESRWKHSCPLQPPTGVTCRSVHKLILIDFAIHLWICQSNREDARYHLGSLTLPLAMYTQIICQPLWPWI